MKSFLPVLAFLLFFSPIYSVAASLWTPIADKLQQSVVFIEMVNDKGESGACSGFMINAAKHEVLTAGHCDGETITVDGTKAVKVHKDERKDLMVLRVDDVDKPALHLSKVPLDRGDEVASFGYGYGLEFPMLRVGHVSSTKFEIEGLSGPFVVVDAPFVPGQSGGPVVNDKGEVVSIVQRTGEGFGIGVGADVIREKVGRYFE